MASAQSIMLWTDKEVSGGASLQSAAINLGQWTDIAGWFSLHVELSDDGTGKFQAGSSANKSNYIYSASASDDIVTAHTKISGPLTNGIQIYQFSPITSQWLKIKVTETGGEDPIVVGAWLTVH